MDYWLKPEVPFPAVGHRRGDARLRNRANSQNANRRVSRVLAAEGGNSDRRAWNDRRRRELGKRVDWLKPEVPFPAVGHRRGDARLRNRANSQNANRRVSRVLAAEGGNSDRRA